MLVKEDPYLKRIEKLEAEIAELRQDIEDDILTEDDLEAIRQAKLDLKNGDTITLEEAERQYGI